MRKTLREKSVWLLKPLSVSSLLLGVSCATLLGCKGKGPPIESCVFAGGEAICVQSDGETVLTKKPEDMDGYWATNPDDLEKYSKWCTRDRDNME